MARSVDCARNYSAIAYVDVSHCEDDFDFNCFIDGIVSNCIERWDSLSVCDKWLEREVHAILENDFAYITVSEYCGLASICVVNRYEYDDVCYSEDIRMSNLSNGWCKLIASRFEKVFGEFRKIGSFSNGEGVFERIA